LLSLAVGRFVVALAPQAAEEGVRNKQKSRAEVLYPWQNFGMVK
jgi:hypothetical protein